MRATSIVCGSRYVPIAAGILALAYVCYAMVDAKLYQASENRRFQQAIAERSPGIKGGPAASTLLVAAALPAPNDEMPGRSQLDQSDSSVVGRIEISTVRIGVMILEGTDEVILQRGVGHVSGTALPGQKGNVVIAGHRDTFFRGLRDIHNAMEITLSTLKGNYRYRVDSTEVVSPQDAEVLYESGEATLTLITCYPFNFVGSAPKRFIVHAHKILG